MITVTQLRSWNPGALERAAQELHASQGALTEIGADAGDAVGMISRGWTGTTSERASAAIRSCVQQADDLAEAVAAARRTMLAAADALAEAKALLADAEAVARRHGMWFTAEGLATPGGAAALDLGAIPAQIKDMVRRALVAATEADRTSAEALRAALAALPAPAADGSDAGATPGAAVGTSTATGAVATTPLAQDPPPPVPPMPGGGALPSMTSVDGAVGGPGAGAREFTASVDGTREAGSPASEPTSAGHGVSGHGGGGGAVGRGGMPMMAGGGMGMGAAAAGGAAARASGQYRMVSDPTARANAREERVPHQGDDVEVIEADDVEVLAWDEDADDDW